MIDWTADAIVKLQRGAEHIKALDDAIGEWRKTDPCPCDVRRILNAETNRYDWTVVRADAPPVRWGAIAGDAVTNLNSALDVLMCQTIRAFTGNPEARQYFPFFKDQEHCDKDLKKRLRHLPPAVANLIREIQPYPTGTYPLWALRQLDNLNKHALLLATATGQSGFTTDMGLLQMNVPTGYIELKAGVILYSESLDTLVRSSPDLFIAFKDTGVADGASMLIVLDVMRRLVENVILAFQKLAPDAPGGVTAAVASPET